MSRYGPLSNDIFKCYEFTERKAQEHFPRSNRDNAILTSELQSNLTRRSRGHNSPTPGTCDAPTRIKIAWLEPQPSYTTIWESLNIKLESIR
jgi:hypothetical protein